MYDEKDQYNNILFSQNTKIRLEDKNAPFESRRNKELREQAHFTPYICSCFLPLKNECNKKEKVSGALFLKKIKKLVIIICYVL